MSQSSGQESLNVYQTCDPVYLRQLREAAGMELHVLAKTACMSLAQVRELEQGTETGVFYSISIRRQAYKRLLMILGAEPPSVAPLDMPLPERQEHQAQLHNLDQIAAMSRLPSMVRSPWAPFSSLLHQLAVHKQVVGAGGLLVIAAVLLVLNWPQGGASSIADSASQAASAVTAVASESAAAVETVLVKSAASEPTVSAPAVVSPMVAVASAPVAVASSAPSKPASVPVATPAPIATACAFSADAMPQVSPMVASKPGRYVHFVSASNVELCVVDGNKQVTTLSLKSGESRSIYGVSPWQVSSTGLNKVQVFFQGWRVSLPAENTQRMTLVEKAIP